VLMRWREGSEEEYIPEAETDSEPESTSSSDSDPASGSTVEAKPKSSPRRKGLKADRLVKVDTFHSYVRPTWQPILSDFCVNLTGITQVS
jgi:hypothetical protein